MVFSIYVVEKRRLRTDDCQPGESEPINSTVPPSQKSNNAAASLKRSRKWNRQESAHSRLASPTRDGNYLCYLLLSAVNSLTADVLLRVVRHFPVMNQGGIWCGGILSAAATSAIIRAQLAIGCLIWARSKGEGQSCPAELQEIWGCHAVSEQIGIRVIPSRCWYNWHQGESILGPRGIPKRVHMWFFKGKGFMSLRS